MASLNLKKPEVNVINLLRVRYKDDEEKLLELAAIGFENRFIELYDMFQRGEISFECLAEELKINIWEAENLLEMQGLKGTNL